MRRTAYLTEWHDAPHAEAANIVAKHDRTLQVWEEEELVHFILGPPEVTAYTTDGRPFQFSHVCYTIEHDGSPASWPLIETIDRPLEVKDFLNRLA